MKSRKLLGEIKKSCFKKKVNWEIFESEKDMEYIFKGLPLTTQLIHDKINKQEYFESIKTELFVIYLPNLHHLKTCTLSCYTSDCYFVLKHIKNWNSLL